MAEANSVSAAYNSVSFLPGEVQRALQGNFRDYLTQRLVLYSDMPDFGRYEAKRQEIESTLKAIDVESRKAYQLAQGDTKTQLVETIRQVTDMNAAYVSQRQGMLFHQPHIMWISLFLMVLIGAFVSGYKMGLSQHKEPFLTTIFALLMACAIYLIIIIEFPLLGKISLDQYNQEFENILRRIP